MNHAVDIPFEEASLDGDHLQLEEAGAIPKRDERTPPEQLHQDRSKIDEDAQIVTPHTLFSYMSCPLKGDYHMQHHKALGLSAFTMQFVQDGHTFENAIEVNLNRWIPKFNRSFGCSLATNVPRLNCLEGVARTKMFDPQTLLNAGKYIRTITQSSYPSILTQVPLRLDRETSNRVFGIDKLTRGLLDVAVWTGATWVLGEVKRTENALIHYCIQTEFYCQMWKSTLPDIPLHTQTFLVTCSPGFAFSNWETSEHRKMSLSNLIVEVVDRELIREPLKENLHMVKAFSGEPNAGCGLFQLRCVECAFRYRCYPRFLTPGKTDIGLLPMSEAAAQRLKASGIDTIEALLATGIDSTVLRDVCSGDEAMKLWRGRARIVQKLGGYSAWRPLPEWRESFWTACSPSEDCKDSSTIRWWTAQGETLDVPLAPYPSVIFTYTQADKRRAFALLTKARRARGEDPYAGPPIIALHGELRSLVRFPYWAFTLESVGALLEEVAKGSHASESVRKWLEKAVPFINQGSKKLPPEKEYTSRMAALATIVKSLIQISDLCKEENDVSSI
jgi:hypothetical protein